MAYRAMSLECSGEQWEGPLYQVQGAKEAPIKLEGWQDGSWGSAGPPRVHNTELMVAMSHDMQAPSWANARHKRVSHNPTIS